MPRRHAADTVFGMVLDQERNDPSVPRWLARSAAVGVRLLVLAVLVWLVAELTQKLTLLIVALLVGLLLAGVVAPVVRRAEARGIPRWVTAAAAVVLLLAAVVGAGALIGARVGDQVPQLREQLQGLADDVSSTFGVDVPLLGSSQSGSAGGGSDGGSSGGAGSSVFGGVVSSLGVLADVLIGAFLTLAFMFLFLKSGPGMWQWLLGKLGGRLREDVDAAGHAAWRTSGAYVRSLTIVAAFDAAGIGLGLALLGVPLALTLAALQFIASYIPTLGSFAAGAVAVLIAYAGQGPGTALAVLGLVIVVQQIGNDVIEPYVMGRKLPLNALAVLAAVTAGGLLWGIAGALLAVPLTAAASAAAHEVWVRHGSRPLAGGEPAPGT